MRERERLDFLKAFSYQHGRSLVGFAVMGGIFGEGIDLVGDQLSGAVIVGVGLPGLSLENMVLKNYFDEMVKKYNLKVKKKKFWIFKKRENDNE